MDNMIIIWDRNLWYDIKNSEAKENMKGQCRQIWKKKELSFLPNDYEVNCCKSRIKYHLDVKDMQRNKQS